MAIFILCAALFINGATDAANSVTGIVSSGVMGIRRASVLAATCDFLGMLCFTLFFPAVSHSVEKLTTFPDGTAQAAVIASLSAVVIWSGAAWAFGIPTSESHGLLAAMTGASAALGGGGFSLIGWTPVIVGLVLSAALGGACGFLVSHLFVKRRVPAPRALLVGGCLITAFFHGAQDGQKFIAFSAACGLLSPGVKTALLTSLVMFFGTFAGGRRIVDKMGREMADFDTKSAVCADLGSGAALLACTAAGFPVSTTHVKMSAAASSSKALGRKTGKSAVLELAAAWILTFPVCGILAYLIIKLLF